MVTLHDKDSGVFIGEISDQQLQQLMDALEEESSIDKDYFVNRAELAFLEDQGLDRALIGLLRTALGDREEMEIVWGTS
ncbi:monogalactosyldiacylglycerol synthase [Methylocaldum marinum]|uniref:Monogalactosyldiacylglycerol synthase n=1 Tax=Methylocaldum marinum TaxID=1432792 RepID=A0A250KZY6_9GAMM|nr:galactosyldiacylglycerol synthase [Methylocaldum marinum]BBA37152.1 monogalactosyldiacylglycerol synthase [Methylocaldum marinum]